MPKRRSLQLRITLAFVAGTIGFFGAAFYVPLALWPVAERAESIQSIRAEAIRALGEVRGAARELRGAAILAYQSVWDESLGRDEQVRGIGAARDRLRGATEEYLRIPRPPEIEPVWRQLEDVDFPALQGAVDRALAAARRPGGGAAVIQGIVAAGATVDANLQRLSELNASAVQRDAERIHARLRRLAIGYVVLAAFGTAGAILLLLQALALLRGYANAAERRVRELEAFAGQVSHDLRSPLQTIQLAVTTIERKAQDETLRRVAARASASVRRLDAMICDLLQFARSDAAVQQGLSADVDAALQELRDELQPVAERAGVTLAVTGAPGLQARVAAIALKTIVANLVENAVKYRRPGPDPRVEVTAAADADRVVVTVHDNGIGIAPEVVPRLFDPFFRGTKRPDSYGLGLATVKRLVDSHHGTVAVESEVGRGSTFSVAFRRAEPRREAQVEPHPATTAAELPIGHPHPPVH